MTRAAVIGAGSWGTAFAQVLVDAGTETMLWARRDDLASSINRTPHSTRPSSRSRPFPASTRR